MYNMSEIKVKKKDFKEQCIKPALEKIIPIS